MGLLSWQLFYMFSLTISLESVVHMTMISLWSCSTRVLCPDMEKGLSDSPDTFCVRTNGKTGLHFGSISCLTRDVAPSDSLSLSDDGWDSEPASHGPKAIPRYLWGLVHNVADSSACHMARLKVLSESCFHGLVVNSILGQQFNYPFLTKK